MRRCFVAMLLLALTGCATAKRGATETFEVLSSPTGASATSTSQWLGVHDALQRQGRPAG